MQKCEIRPPLSEKCLNLQSPKLSRVTTSGTSSLVQNFMTIRSRGFASPLRPRVRKCVPSDSARFLVLPSLYSQSHAPIFTPNTCRSAVISICGRFGLCCAPVKSVSPSVGAHLCDFIVCKYPKSFITCLLYTSPSPRDGLLSRMPSSA